MINLLAFVVTLVIDLITDVTLIRKGKSPKHGWSVLYRNAGFVTGAYLEYQNIWIVAAVVVSLNLLYWIVFDLLMNIARGMDLLYSGKTSMIDRLIGQVKDEWEVIIKISVFLISLTGVLLLVRQQKNKNPYDKTKQL